VEVGMSGMGHVRKIADAAWSFLLARGVAPTPRNYELAFAYIGREKPPLVTRVNAVTKAGASLTPGLLDELHREFFATSVDTGALRESSGELQQIASELVTRVAADSGKVREVGEALGSFATAVRQGGDASELHKVAMTLSDASTVAGDRLIAMERLFAASVKRITDLRKRLAKVEEEATRDGLTGLANRRLYDTMLQRAALRAGAEGSPLSLMMLDIDHFKKFNDTHGHVVGDHVLRLFAQVLNENIKGRDTAARYGGEEFSIILPGANAQGAMAVAEQIRGMLENRPILNRATGKRLGVVTCSIGVAQYRPGEPVGETVDRADQAMYRAKREGRNMVRSGD
jgi:diguanylate cyclase